MRNILKVTFLPTLLAITACAAMEESSNPTAAGLLPKTAGTLGVMMDQLEIVDIRSDGSNTYYVAKTSNGNYACQVMSGRLAGVSTAGYSFPPNCTKQ